MYSAPGRSEERRGLREDSTRLQTDLTVSGIRVLVSCACLPRPNGPGTSSLNPRCGFQSSTFRPIPFAHVKRPVDSCQRVQHPVLLVLPP
jgi:hypothetical protein